MSVTFVLIALGTAAVVGGIVGYRATRQHLRAAELLLSEIRNRSYMSPPQEWAERKEVLSYLSNIYGIASIRTPSGSDDPGEYN